MYSCVFVDCSRTNKGGCCREVAVVENWPLVEFWLFYVFSTWLTSVFFIFLDSFLRMRDKADHEATAMMKAQFMSLWDGKQIVIQSLLFTLCKSLLWYYFLFSNCDILGARPIDSATLNCQLTPRLRWIMSIPCRQTLQEISPLKLCPWMLH